MPLGFARARGAVVEAVFSGGRPAMKNLLGVLSERLRSGPLARPVWIDVSGPRLPCFVLALTVPFLLSGAIRALTSLSLPLSLGLAVVVCAGLGRVLWPWLRALAAGMRDPQNWIVEAAGLLPIGFAIWALYARDFGGFPNLDGWDGGSHVFIKDKFASTTPAIYSGQVTYYAFTWWIEKLLHLDSLRSFAAAFYVAVTATLAFPLMIAFAIVRGEASASRGALAAGIAVTVLGTLGVLWLVVLPLLHYNQAGGYYVHVFGLLPLMVLWAADALIRLQPVRVAALIGGFVLLRYTYSLNLADVALAVAFVLLVEGFRGRWRIVQGLVLAGLGVAALMIVPELRPIFRLWGGMQRFDVDNILKADLLLVAGLCLYAAVTSWKGPLSGWLCSPLSRAIRFPLIFALAGSAFLSIFRQGAGVQYYYVTKYQIWACILLAFAFVILLAHLAAVLAQRPALRRPSVWLRALLVAALLATVPGIWLKTFADYRTTLQERMRPHGPPYAYLRPLVDVEAIARIKSVLSGSNKRFGGYLTAFYPMFCFMNATLGHPPGDFEVFFSPDTHPGYCVFWVTKELDIYRLGPAANLDALRSKVAAADASCAEYPVPWKTTPQSLCHRCY
jgi:hypothetical protein